MEIANQLAVRVARQEDAQTIARLLRHANYKHIHADWHLPVDWLGSPAFVVAEGGDFFSAGDQTLHACLAIGADPPPAAWVRVVAVGRNVRAEAAKVLQRMQDVVVPQLRISGVTHVGWLPGVDWPDSWVQALGFRHIDEVITLIKRDLTIPDEIRGNLAVTVRSVRDGDLTELAAIEREAFDPLWRHSVEGLRKSRQHALSFDVAEMDGQIVGFQYSAKGEIEGSAHLVRVTVRPSAQRLGVGSMLLAEAIRGYRRKHRFQVSLNTQLSNEPSRHLYERFGFEPSGYQWPVWALDL